MWEGADLHSTSPEARSWWGLMDGLAIEVCQALYPYRVELLGALLDTASDEKMEAEEEAERRRRPRRGGGGGDTGMMMNAAPHADDRRSGDDDDANEEAEEEALYWEEGWISLQGCCQAINTLLQKASGTGGGIHRRRQKRAAGGGMTMTTTSAGTPRATQSLCEYVLRRYHSSFASTRMAATADSDATASVLFETEATTTRNKKKEAADDDEEGGGVDRHRPAAETFGEVGGEGCVLTLWPRYHYSFSSSAVGGACGGYPGRGGRGHACTPRRSLLHGSERSSSTTPKSHLRFHRKADTTHCRKNGTTRSSDNNNNNNSKRSLFEEEQQEEEEDHDVDEEGESGSWSVEWVPVVEVSAVISAVLSAAVSSPSPEEEHGRALMSEG